MKPVYLGGYRLVAKLQRDQVRDSYLARRADPGRAQDMVVLTRLRNTRGPDNELLSVRAELPPEVDLIPLLEHPSIVATYEFNHSGLTPYWVTEYIEGQPLDRVLEAVSEHGGLPITFALHVLCRLLAALDYAHNLDAAGETFTIVHGNVRAQNVYLTYQGEVKLAGFGVPRLPRVEATRDDEPEAFAPSRSDPGADILAVGLLIRELLSQRLRSTSDAPASVFPRESLPRASMSDAQLMQMLTPISERALEREPEHRYATAEEMQSDLLQVLERVKSADNLDVTAALKTFVRQLFERERRDYSRRISLLIAIDDSLEPTAEREEPGRNFITMNFRLPTFLRLAPPSREDPRGPPPPTAATPPVPRARDSAQPPSTIPHSRPRELAAHSSAPPAREWFEARLPILLSAAVLAGLIAFVWLFGHTESPHDVAAAAALPAKSKDLSTVLRLCGSNTVGAELAPALVEALFASKNNATKVAHERATDSSSSVIRASLDNQELTAEITALGTATGFVGLGDGSCDIAMASRAVNGSEAALSIAKSLGDLHSAGNEHVIALDGVAMIVHPENPVSALNRSELRDIYTGRIKNWAALGGNDLDIRVLARDDKSGTHDTFQQLILGAEKISPSAQRHASNVALADAVVLDPAAIGFVGLAYVRTAKALAVSDAGSAPRLPTPFTVATESYLLTRRLYFYTNSEPRTAWVSELVSFALSPAGQAIAKKAGFIDLTLLVDNPRCAECSARYRSVTANAVRASVDIRFQSGSITPDSRARRDLNRLVALLSEYRQAKVLLLGFSDGLGNPSDNLKLSYVRANVVAEELAVRGIQSPVVLGFGSEMPITSNETPEGRERNRRVEVWLQQR